MSVRNNVQIGVKSRASSERDRLRSLVFRWQIAGLGTTVHLPVLRSYAANGASGEQDDATEAHSHSGDDRHAQPQCSGDDCDGADTEERAEEEYDSDTAMAWASFGHANNVCRPHWRTTLGTKVAIRAMWSLAAVAHFVSAGVDAGAWRCRVACSYAYASPKSVGSAHARPSI